MFQISRERHCALAGMEVGAFKTLQQYGRLPVLPRQFTADKGFGPIETLALAISNEMVEQHHVAREHAAGVCSAAAILSTRWNEVRETVAQRRATGKDELLFGRVTVPGTREQGGGPRPVLGTLAEIADEHGDAAMTIIAVSVSRVAEGVRNLAEKHGIDMEQFWAQPLPDPASKARPRKKAPSR
jgi:hypothetical protein